jgi:hypothetical protein
MDWIGVGQDRDVAGSCVRGNELLGCIKCGQFIDQMRTG